MKLHEILVESSATVTIEGIKFKKKSEKDGVIGVSYIAADDSFFIANNAGLPAKQCKAIEDVLDNGIKIIRTGKSVGQGGFSFEEEHTKDHFGGELFSVWFGDPNTTAAKEMRANASHVQPVQRINFLFNKSVKDEKTAEKVIAAFIKNAVFTK